ncbi:hypothetical protein KO02_14035 [Sphingobacterium sp. ML3W]|nr:hypothetical protein KO02_14035 [Sphingobacterium sp. ML3W]
MIQHVLRQAQMEEEHEAKTQPLVLQIKVLQMLIDRLYVHQSILQESNRNKRKNSTKENNNRGA